MPEQGDHLAGWARARVQIGWAMFEFARTPYIGLVYIFAFAPYFAATVVGDPVRGQEIWSLANTLVSVCIALLAPAVGAIADRTGYRKRWLAVVVTVMVPCCFALWLALPAGLGGLPVPFIMAIIVLIHVAFELGQVFHNSMLPELPGTRHIGWVSGLGLALGNTGNLLATLALLIWIALPASGDQLFAFIPTRPLFDLDVASHEHDRIAGPLAGLWLLVFTLPFFLWTPDRRGESSGLRDAVSSGLESLWHTARQAGRLSNVGTFLLARMLYNDSMVAIQAYSGILAAGLFGWNLTALLIFSICLSPFTIFGGFLGGWLDRRFGSRRSLLVSIAGTGVFLVGALSMAPGRVLFLPLVETAGGLWSFPYFQTLPEVLFIVMYMLLALMITVALVSSRAMMARIAPVGMFSQFFGLYAVSGWATAFLGHGLVSIFTSWFGDQRAGVAAVLLLIVPALLMMVRVREERPRDFQSYSHAQAPHAAA